VIAGQAPSQATLIAEIKQVLRANIGWQRILSYLRFLEGSLLVRLVRPLELRLEKVRGPAKLCIVDHGLRQSWLEEMVPLDPEGLEQSPHLADLAGHIAESVVIPKDCKRLAEVDFPIAEVSRRAAREKSIRHGHPSTLHLWWAGVMPGGAARAALARPVRSAVSGRVQGGGAETARRGG
jgi:hypothetical protein